MHEPALFIVALRRLYNGGQRKRDTQQGSPEHSSMTRTDDLRAPLSDDEIDRLDHFLLNRVDDSDEEDPDRDEGVVGVSELDGFLTAIVSGPETVPPSVWMPALWGDAEVAWQSEDQLTEIFTLLMRHMNTIAIHLMEEPETFEPIFLTRTVEDTEYLVVDDWCTGYLRALSLTNDAWRRGGDQIESLLQPLFAFGTPAGWDALDKLNDEEVVSLQQSVTPAVCAIHAFWLERRSPGAGAPFRHSAPRVGRNDPCPCGSGKKYKHCCLH